MNWKCLVHKDCGGMIGHFDAATIRQVYLLDGELVAGPTTPYDGEYDSDEPIGFVCQECGTPWTMYLLELDEFLAQEGEEVEVVDAKDLTDAETKQLLKWHKRDDARCRRLWLDFHGLPDALYDALLNEFRRQFPEYDGNSWRWDIVASEADHPDAEAIYEMCQHPKETHPDTE